MRRSFSLGLSILLPCLLALPACGGSDGDGETGAESGESDEGMSTEAGDGDSETSSTSGDGDGDTTGDGDGDGDTTGDGDGDTTGDGDGDTTGDGDGDTTGDGDGDCQVWEITYDLEGTIFEIADTPFGAGDQINTLQMPYDDDTNFGPGSMTIYFDDVNGDPGGNAYIGEYALTLNFVVDGATTVTTDLQNNAGPDACGVSSGPINGNVAEWNPATMADHHSMGSILCEGALCGAGGLPNGEPVPVDETTDYPIGNFDFSGDFSAFDGAETIVQMDSNSTSLMTYSGTETGRQLVDAPACLCG